MDQRNMPTAVLEFLTPAGSLGTWVASDWAGDAALVEAVRNGYAQMGAGMAQKIAGELVAPQTIEVGGKKFTFTMRPKRIYHPFSLTLLKATHTVYPGTDIPKDFRSRVRIEQSADRREARGGNFHEPSAALRRLHVLPIPDGRRPGRAAGRRARRLRCCQSCAIPAG